MSEQEKRIEVEIWLADAIVLFDWLMTVDFDAIPITHRAEKQALTDLLNQLEQSLPLSPTQEQIDEARKKVAKDMDW